MAHADPLPLEVKYFQADITAQLRDSSSGRLIEFGDVHPHVSTNTPMNVGSLVMTARMADVMNSKRLASLGGKDASRRAIVWHASILVLVHLRTPMVCLLPTPDIRSKLKLPRGSVPEPDAEEGVAAADVLLRQVNTSCVLPWPEDVDDWVKQQRELGFGVDMPALALAKRRLDLVHASPGMSGYWGPSRLPGYGRAVAVNSGAHALHAEIHSIKRVDKDGKARVRAFDTCMIYEAEFDEIDRETHLACQRVLMRFYEKSKEAGKDVGKDWIAATNGKMVRIQNMKTSYIQYLPKEVLEFRLFIDFTTEERAAFVHQWKVEFANDIKELVAASDDALDRLAVTYPPVVEPKPRPAPPPASTTVSPALGPMRGSSSDDGGAMAAAATSSSTARKRGRDEADADPVPPARRAARLSHESEDNARDADAEGDDDDMGTGAAVGKASGALHTQGSGPLNHADTTLSFAQRSPMPTQTSSGVSAALRGVEVDSLLARMAALEERVTRSEARNAALERALETLSRSAVTSRMLQQIETLRQ